MKEFRSQLEQIMSAEELFFEPTPAFGRYKPFLEHAIAHPAKANTKLLEFLVKAFTKPGDVVLDPMAGSGSTGVVAALHGRNAVQVELEAKFYQWMEKARENVEKHSTLTPKGKIVNICGDARRLSELLKGVGFEPTAAITSPPFTNAAVENLNVWKYRKGGMFAEEKIDACITSPPYSNAISKQGGPVDVRNVGVSTITAREYSQNPSNIGNLPLGEVSAIITSPPYADAKKGGEADRERMAERWDEAFRGKGETWNSWGKTWHTPGRLRGLEALGSGYSKSEQNIGNLPLGEISAEYQEKLTQEKSLFMDEYGGSKGNIGNLKRETYLEAMLRVYGEMFKVLKPNGLAIIIVKPFIRQKRVMDLPWHTWLLMAKVGFKLEKLYKLRLKSQSFWRILYARKFPDAERICHEYIIIARKPRETG
jgi:DNA modification methylase